MPSTRHFATVPLGSARAETWEAEKDAVANGRRIQSVGASALWRKEKEQDGRREVLM